MMKRIAFKQVLSQAGFSTVLESDNAVSALMLLGEGLVDWVFTVFTLPEREGVAQPAGASLIKALKNIGRNKNLPVVLLDEGMSQQEVVAAVKTGIAGRLGHPPNLEKLMQIFKTLELDMAAKESEPGSTNPSA